MEEEIYIIKRNAFGIYKTTNLEIKDRAKDFQNSYPINIPKCSKGESRIDGVSKDAYFYGLRDMDTTKNPLIALIEINYEGIQKITHLIKGFIK